MLAFPEMIESCARDAGMAVPENLEVYDPEEFVHWHVFCLLQLGQPMPYPNAHWDNAHVIAEMSVEEIKTYTYSEFIAKGFNVGFG